MELVKGQGAKTIDGWLAWEFLTLHNGLGMDLDRYGAFVDVVTADHSSTGTAVQGSLILTSEAAGIPNSASDGAP